jgi:hypothetical protein
VADEDKDKPQLDVPPTSQVDLAARLEADHGGGGAGVVSPLDSDDDSVNPTKQRDLFAVEDNDTSEYIGVSEEYRTYANETEKPYEFGGVEADAVAAQLEDQFAIGKDAVVEVEHTLGGGSRSETVTTHESGENYQPEVVEAPEAEEPEEAASPKVSPPTVSTGCSS